MIEARRLCGRPHSRGYIVKEVGFNFVYIVNEVCPLSLSPYRSGKFYIVNLAIPTPVVTRFPAALNCGILFTPPRCCDRPVAHSVAVRVYAAVRVHDYAGCWIRVAENTHSRQLGE